MLFLHRSLVRELLHWQQVGFCLHCFCCKYLFRRWYIAAGVIALGVAAFAGVNAYNHNVLIARMQGMFQAEQEKYALTAVETDRDVIFTMNGHELHMALEGKEADAGVLLTVKRERKSLPVRQMTLRNGK